jgi:Class III cytochrome C family
LKHATKRCPMNRRWWIVLLVAIGWIPLQASMGGWAVAQEDTYELAHEDVFGKLQRPPVTFPHDIHMDGLECGACHHVYDEDEGALVPVDDPDTGCTECHGAHKEGDQPALREAYHGGCTACHREKARKSEKTGPTTCGECHKKE